jgi:hypothetical protein
MVQGLRDLDTALKKAGVREGRMLTQTLHLTEILSAFPAHKSICLVMDNHWAQLTKLYLSDRTYGGACFQKHSD